MDSKLSEFNEDQIKWLKQGPKIDEVISIDGIAGPKLVEYRVLERNSDGCIFGLDKRKGRKGFVLKVADTSYDDLDTDEEPILYALKVCLADEYQELSKIKHEYQRSNKLGRNSDSFIGLNAAGYIKNDIQMPDINGKKLIGIVTPWVEGKTLRYYYKEHQEIFTVNSVLSISIQLVEALHLMELNNLKHDDLHFDNIMITSTGQVLDTRARIVIVDTGSLKLKD